MKVKTEDKKQEALCRMAKLGIIPEAIRQFKDDDRVNVSEPPMGALYWADDDDMKRIREFEEQNDALVYAVVRTYFNTGKMDSYLYVSDHKDEWPMDNEDIGNGEVLAYVYNHDDPEMSELGYIGVKRTAAAGLVRTW